MGNDHGHNLFNAHSCWNVESELFVSVLLLQTFKKKNPPRTHTPALCVYIEMCSVLQATLTECIQLVATQTGCLAVYHVSSCMLSASHFWLHVHTLYSHPDICVGLILFLCYLLCVWR